MFKISLQIFILIYILLVIYNIIYLQKYNINGYIIETNDETTLKENIIKLNPVLLYQNNTFEIDSNIDSLSDIINYKNNIPNYIYKHNGISIHFDQKYFFYYKLLEKSHLHFPISKYITIICGKNSIPLKRCIHNCNIIGILDGSTTIYLFNPKHKEEIINKENNQIKKWGHKKVLKKGDILFIPPYWSILQEIDNKVIQYHIDIDSYFTFIPNYFKDLD